ncbi:hypothetical protein WT49_09080 [Burkholderia territorii]|nr:hypothetical protein WT49_09080 [Burkholderia territorii]KWE41486.1 hypothetical protein WT51_25540 [Burkholderia territorii]KWE43483.1 hypothetical protein WT50_11040 [Burkholderia territorii]
MSGAMTVVSRLAIAALLAAAVAPAFARGMPQLPDDDGSRAGVLRMLDPASASASDEAHVRSAVGVASHRGDDTERKAATGRTCAS